MSVVIRPASPVALPRAMAAKAGRDRLWRGLANAITVLSAIVAILMVASAAVVMGIS